MKNENGIEERQMSDIKLFKLSNGDEIVARKQTDTQTNTVVLEQPMNLATVPNETTRTLGIALVPWPLGAKEDITVTISRDHILVETFPNDTIEKSYLSKITGLTL
jgi:hypothetical protein